ncbi:3-keto-disaccharide hydrolase [Algibacter mikhailovii]|uniref:3-keto-alpha-glucoside-1,2-lyase/3-keto-2-hydroxy-glucal hydratase domain-containing protein n=1 Tax=Algibacter mikhailovii TaxID=425498 RepID=A0A918V415_9FLAO|nr:DUF1080 domain-containing protein [Algibacter mikhailovii]GGZ67662.1 hypothetical protein GCM10007028_00680 [Algibacter mikhailovii]
MKITYLGVLACCMLVFTLQAQKSKDLFNGKNFKGWKVLNGTAEYTIEDNAIVGTSKTGTPNTFLATKKEYTNFILDYEILLGAGLNSGVQIRSRSISDYNNGRVHGLQVEADDSERNWFGGLFDEARKGWRYPLEYNPEVKRAYKRGQWNKIKVIAAGNHIATWVNGINMTNLYEESVETGFIGLQVHSIGNSKEKAGKTIKWRNIKLTEIPEDYKFETTAPVLNYALNSIVEEEKENGWKLLWDGKSTTGWRGAKMDDFPKTGWVMNDGILTVQASGGGESEHGGDIVTTKPYENFILELDFKYTKGANSGIKYFVDTELNKGKGSAIGCEFQILDDAVHPDAKKGTNGNRTIGSLYDLIKANAQEYIPSLYTKKYVNKSGWNRARIVVNGNLVQHYLNGCKVIEYTRGNQMWRALVAYSKYRDWPNFGEAKSGLILLQDHGDEVHFKNIKIKEL